MIDVTQLATDLTVMSITPGPNNVMVTASGASFGYRATVPHILGVGIGAALQTALVCVGLGELFERWPLLHAAMTWVGAAYLIWMAWRLVGAGAVSGKTAARPITLLEAVAFQAVNPKAWVIAMTTAAVFLPRHGPVAAAALLVALLFLLINVPCVSVWALFGSGLRRLLSLPGYRRVFNVTMSVLLVMTAVLGVQS
jgi:threonine/homoserine/homoserine lactone efflux protein